MPAFGKDAEARLIACLQDIQELIDDGESPSDAVVKAATQHGLHRDALPVVVQAVNIGRQEFQRKQAAGRGILDKIAAFPLADITEVLQRMYPGQPALAAAAKKAASARVSSDYRRPPHAKASASPLLKMASPPLPATECRPEAADKIREVRTKQALLRNEISERRVDLVRTRNDLTGKIRELGRYCQRHPNKLAEVSYNVLRNRGSTEHAVLLAAAASVQLDKQAAAAAPARLAGPVRWEAEPYSLIRDVVAAGERHLAAKRAAVSLDETVDDRLAGSWSALANDLPELPTRLLGRPDKLAELAQWQKAGFFDKIVGPVATGLSLGASQQFKPKSRSEVIDGLVDDLNDPIHDNEMRAIRAKAMLGDLLANDEVISGYQPIDVSEAYNEMVQLVPSAAAQPSIMRPLLRRRLTAGTLEPFEAEQMTKLEKNIRQVESMGGRSAWSHGGDDE